MIIHTLAFLFIHQSVKKAEFHKKVTHSISRPATQIPAPAPLPAPAPPPTSPPPAPPPVPSYPVAPPGSYANSYDWGNCTWYVAGRKEVPNSWGNADTWAYYAGLAGYTVSSRPQIGAIAQESLGLGHVAIVEGISSDGSQVEVSEMNVQGLGVVDDAWYPVSTFNYIYI